MATKLDNDVAVCGRPGREVGVGEENGDNGNELAGVGGPRNGVSGAEGGWEI